MNFDLNLNPRTEDMCVASGKTHRISLCLNSFLKKNKKRKKKQKVFFSKAGEPNVPQIWAKHAFGPKFEKRISVNGSVLVFRTIYIVQNVKTSPYEEFPQATFKCILHKLHLKKTA